MALFRMLIFCFIVLTLTKFSASQFGGGIYRDTSPQCINLRSRRRNCGFPGITPDTCASRRCCFDNSIAEFGIPHCYFGVNDARKLEDIPPEPKPTTIEGLPAPSVGSVFGNANNFFPTNPPSEIDNLLGQLGISADPTPPTKAPVKPSPGSAPTQCQLVQSLNQSPDIQESLRKELGCTGDEIAVSDDEINAGASSLFESLLNRKTTTKAPQKTTKKPKTTTVKPKEEKTTKQSAISSLIDSLTGQGQGVTSSNALVNELLGNNVQQVGGLEPNFGPGGPVDLGPPTENPLCKSLKGDKDFQKLAPILGCKVDLLELLTNSLIGDIDEIEKAKILSPGAIDPAKIPVKVLLECIETRHKYASCDKGFSANIVTDTECFNLGCIPFDYHCFKCLLVPDTALINRPQEFTCSVAESEQETCPGFSNIALISALTSGGLGGGSSSSSSGLGALTGGGAGALSLLGGLGGAGGGLGGGNLGSSLLPLLLGGGGLGGLGLRSGVVPEPRIELADLLLGGAGGGTSSALSALTGGGGGTSSALLSLLGGGAANPQAQLIQALLGGNDDEDDDDEPKEESLEEKYCKSKGCCFRKATGIQAILGLGGKCYKKGKKSLSAGKDCTKDRKSGRCGQNSNSAASRLFGGSPVPDIDERPWQALLKKGNDVRCSGVVICRNWILTAASCLVRIALSNEYQVQVPDIQVDSLQVITGSLSPSGTGGTSVIHKVEQIVPHPQFNFRQNYNNIAAIRIRPIPQTSTFRPICLPSVGEFSLEKTNRILQVNGYGVDGVTGTDLREIEMKVLSEASCNSAFPSAVPRSGVFCAKSVNSGDDTCYGDGGAPAIYNDQSRKTFTLVGINFGGSENCDGSKPSLFTSVAQFRVWILDTTNGCCALPGRF